MDIKRECIEIIFSLSVKFTGFGMNNNFKGSARLGYAVHIIIKA